MAPFSAILAAVISAANSNPDGFTLDLETFTLATSGVAVALEATQNSHGTDGLARVIDYCIDNNIRYIGGWLDSTSGKFYYDATVVLSDRAKAIELGRLNHHLAIFDMDECQEIRL